MSSSSAGSFEAKLRADSSRVTARSVFASPSPVSPSTSQESVDACHKLEAGLLVEMAVRSVRRFLQLHLWAPPLQLLRGLRQSIALPLNLEVSMWFHGGQAWAEAQHRDEPKAVAFDDAASQGPVVLLQESRRPSRPNVDAVPRLTVLLELQHSTS